MASLERALKRQEEEHRRALTSIQRRCDVSSKKTPLALLKTWPVSKSRPPPASDPAFLRYEIALSLLERQQTARSCGAGDNPAPPLRNRDETPPDREGAEIEPAGEEAVESEVEGAQTAAAASSTGRVEFGAALFLSECAAVTCRRCAAVLPVRASPLPVPAPLAAGAIAVLRLLLVL